MTNKYFSILLFLLFALITNNGLAQSSNSSGIVSYSFYTNLGRAVQSDWDLLFEGNKSIFMISSGLKYLNKDSNGPNDKSFKLKVNKQLTPHLINNFEKDSIYSQGLVFKEPYYVQDPIRDPEWKLHSESKSISGFSCNKATTTFRGRNYEVWYTPEIPVNFGPWKLNGLPGLILMVTDEKNQIEISATRVKLGESIDIEEQISKLPKLGKKVSLREYVSEKDKEGEQISKFIKSKSSRGGNTTSSFEKPEKRNGLEIIYEWEEE